MLLLDFLVRITNSDMIPGIPFSVAKAFGNFFFKTFLFYIRQLNETNLPLKTVVCTICQCKYLLLSCVLFGFLPIFYEEVYHVFLQTVEVGIHQPCSDVHSRVPGEEKREKNGKSWSFACHLHKLDFATMSMDSGKCAKADLFLSTYRWINRGE